MTNRWAAIIVQGVSSKNLHYRGQKVRSGKRSRDQGLECKFGDWYAYNTTENTLETLTLLETFNNLYNLPILADLVFIFIAD